jgi:hypothetical protein
MALQKINWLQIDTVPPSGSTVVLGSEISPLEGIYVNNLDLSGSLVVGGNLTVQGTTTIIESTTISLGDNIIELNGMASSLAGLIVNDPTSPNLVSGSLLWDASNDRWIGGPSGSESIFLMGSTSGTTYHLQKLNGSGNTLEDSRVIDDGTMITISGATTIKGDLIVEGKTILVQKNDSDSETLIVSGAMKIVENLINSQIISASLNISGLGTLSSPTANAEIDLGGFF